MGKDRGKEKRPTKGVSVPVKRKPVVPLERPAKGELISWRLGFVELDGPWPWTALPRSKAAQVREFLRSMEQRTWADVQQGHKPQGKQIPLASAVTKAQNRLEALGFDDFDLTSFHLQGKERIWGIRQGQSCLLIWWDPRHEVCPSEPKHT